MYENNNLPIKHRKQHAVNMLTFPAQTIITQTKTSKSLHNTSGYMYTAHTILCENYKSTDLITCGSYSVRSVIVGLSQFNHTGMSSVVGVTTLYTDYKAATSKHNRGYSSVTKNCQA